MDSRAPETSDSTKEKSACIDTITAMDRQMSETSDSTKEKSAGIDTITAMDRQMSETSDSTRKKSAAIDTISTSAMDSQMSETSDNTKEKSAGIDTINAMESQTSEPSDSTKEKSVAVDTITAMDNRAPETSDSTQEKNKSPLTLSLQWIVQRQKLQIVQRKNQSPLTLSLQWIVKRQKRQIVQRKNQLPLTLSVLVQWIVKSGIDTINAMESQTSEPSDSTKEKSVAVDTITAMDSRAPETSDSTKEKSVAIDTITAMDSQASETSDSTKEKSACIDTINEMDSQASETPDSTKEKSAGIDTFTAMDSQTLETSDMQEIKKGDKAIISITPVTIKTGNDQQTVNKDEVVYVAEPVGCSTQQEMNSTTQQKLDSPIEITQGFDFDDEDLDEQYDKNDPDYILSSEEQFSDKSLEVEYIHSLNKIHKNKDSVIGDSDISMEDEHGEASNILQWPALEKNSPKNCYSIQENNIIRDVSNPGINVRKVRKSKKASKAQMKYKKAKNEPVYDNFHSCLFCGGNRQHISSHMYVHKNIPKAKEILAKAKKDFSKLRKHGDNKHNKKVVSEGKGELILSRRPESNAVVFDSSQYGPCINCYEWLLFKNMKRHLEACTMQTVTMSR
ncbi:unnamed protein product [Mytilus coruscus]|uniref:Uncharacterized protein n=1 Tax=Mytilus coruscus TaxID=42192 RepID=A0A6J8BKT8_MYTCO|nr:unnamed protein product [Mytilus coruscus]